MHNVKTSGLGIRGSEINTNTRYQRLLEIQAQKRRDQSYKGIKRCCGDKNGGLINCAANLGSLITI